MRDKKYQAVVVQTRKSVYNHIMSSDVVLDRIIVSHELRDKLVVQVSVYRRHEILEALMVRENNERVSQ